jgi:molecular chaperone GrpE
VTEKKNESPAAGKTEAEDKIQVSKKEYEELQARVKELEALKDKFLRSAADFDNAKKRLMRERDEFIKFGQENLIRSLLPVVDNMERALAHAGEEKDSNAKALVTGLQMVWRQLMEILKGQGLTRIKTAGEKFDPHWHEAVGHVEEKGKEDEIVEEVEPGYKLHDRLLRAAKVKIRVSPSRARVDFKSEEDKQDEIT